jgi:hypothetical protein
MYEGGWMRGKMHGPGKISRTTEGLSRRQPSIQSRSSSYTASIISLNTNLNEGKIHFGIWNKGKREEEIDEASYIAKVSELSSSHEN